MKDNLKEELIEMGVHPSLLELDTDDVGSTIPITVQQLDILSEELEEGVLDELSDRLGEIEEGILWVVEHHQPGTPITTKDLGLYGRDLWLLGYIYATRLDSMRYSDVLADRLHNFSEVDSELRAKLLTWLQGLLDSPLGPEIEEISKVECGLDKYPAMLLMGLAGKLADHYSQALSFIEGRPHRI
jgi:hypothetical protein